MLQSVGSRVRKDLRHRDGIAAAGERAAKGQRLCSVRLISPALIKNLRVAEEIGSTMSWNAFKSWLTITVLVYCVSLLITQSAVAQRPEPVDDEATVSSPSNVDVVERRPRVVYATDENGKRVPFVNLTFDEIARLLNTDDPQKENREPPQYQINRVQFKGLAETDRATLTVSVDITTLADEANSTQDQWVAIPLRLHECSLLDAPEYEGEGKLLLTHDKTNGYQAWIRYQSTSDHRLQLRFSTNLSQAALATQVRFFPPAANVSTLELDVPGERITSEIQNGRDLKITPSAESRSIITANNLRNQVIVVWRDGVEARDDKTTYLDARGEIQVSIEGPGTIRSDIALDVTSYGEEIESFQLRLPPRTTIISTSEQGYRITELNRPTITDDNERRTVQVILDKPGIQIQLLFSTQTTGSENGNESDSSRFDVASFEVLGALRQSGRVTLMSSEDWLVYWYLGPSVRRVQATEETTDSQDRKRLATFEYFRQPCQLAIEIKTQSTRVSVEPSYRLKVDEDRVDLEVFLRYTIRGARSSFLNFDLNGWELDDVGPSSTVENDHFQDSSDSKVKLRLTQPRTGEFELVLRLHRPVTEPSGTLRFPLPWPTYDNMSPGIVIVSPAEAIVLNYRLEEMVGLVQESVPPEFATAPSPEAQPPAAFRIRNDRASGDVVMDYEVRGREIRVRADALMDISAETADVSQRFTYRVLYEPASRLELTMPRELYRLLVNPRYRSAVELQVDNQILNSDDLLIASNDVNGTSRTVNIGIALPQPKLGTIDVLFKYPWRISSSGTRFHSIPLAMPADGQLLANTARLTPRGPMQVELSPEAIWEQDEGVIPAEAGQSLALAAEFPTLSLPLRVSQQQENADPESPQGATEVRLAWLQTWLANQSRQDRIVYRLASGSDNVYLQLSQPVDGSVILVVDGVENPTNWIDGENGSELEIRIPRGDQTEHTIELAVQYNDRPAAGAMTFNLPRFRDASSPRRWFWQLILPESEHLMLVDPHLTSSNRFERRGWFWYRTGSHTQLELEDWTDATTQPEIPETANQYLFTSIDRLDPITVRTSPRRQLVYAISVTVLAFGLTLIYIPLLRHPVILLALAVGLLISVSLFPSGSLILAQASLLGSLLVVLSLFLVASLRWIQPRRSRLHSAVRQGDSHSEIQVSWRDNSNGSNSTSTTTSLPVADSKA